MAVAYDWIVIGNAVLMRMALTIVGLFDVCAMALIVSVQMAKVEVRNAICSTHWQRLQRAKDLAESRNLLFSKICILIRNPSFILCNLSFIETGISF